MFQPSSPVLKARRQSRRLYLRMLYTILSFCAAIWILHLLLSRHDSTHRGAYEDVKDVTFTHSAHQSFDTTSVKPIARNFTDSPEVGSLLTAILPITTASLSGLYSHLDSLVSPSGALVEVVLLTPRALHVPVRRALRTILSESEHSEVEFSIVHWPDGVSQAAAVLQAGQRATTHWVLLADEQALSDINPRTRDHLLLNEQPSATTPQGPRGVLYTADGPSCVVPSRTPQEASYMLPPFIIPTMLLPPSTETLIVEDAWKYLADYADRGIVFDFSDDPGPWCPFHHPASNESLLSRTLDADHLLYLDPQTTLNVSAAHASGSGVFVLVTLASQIRYLTPVICGIANGGHHTTLLALLDPSTSTSGHATSRAPCLGAVHVIHVPSSYPTDAQPQLQQLPGNADVVISVGHEKDSLGALLYAVLRATSFPGHTVSHVNIPSEDLPYCDWMGSLSLEEWISA